MQLPEMPRFASRRVPNPMEQRRHRGVGADRIAPAKVPRNRHLPKEDFFVPDETYPADAFPEGVLGVNQVAAPGYETRFENGTGFEDNIAERLPEIAVGARYLALVHGVQRPILFKFVEELRINYRLFLAGVWICVFLARPIGQPFRILNAFERVPSCGMNAVKLWLRIPVS